MTAPSTARLGLAHANLLPLGDLPDSRGEAQRVNGYVDPITVLGLREEPGHVEGYEPIDVDRP
jgi:hypothetical protein